MFDVTPEDILRLSDSDLRELVARLATAELVRHGHSVHAVTAGGHQDAPDGGVDVRVELAVGASPGPNLPRHVIGYQVKHPDMKPSAIRGEMRPRGQLRPVIAELAAAGGAYIIVSAQGSIADRPLRERRAAMRLALEGDPDVDRLHTDFYDRTRLANWVREFPGVVLWVREQVGRALAGWRPYANWSNRGEPANAPYLVDERVRIRFGREEQPVNVKDAIARLRGLLQQPGTAVRLVGLSGVGKTRLVQALFDPDPTIGTDPLPRADVVYTDFHERTTPQPEGMAENLLAQDRQAILIIDNCSSASHARLTSICQARGSTISLLTVEYDVRDDVPESTHVVEMEPASESLIEDLLRRRYPTLSRENAHTIAHVSDGNARVALAIAGTVREGEELVGLRAGELFDRLFHQRNATDDNLLRAAEVCALVYSFDGETEEGDQAELPVLAQLAQMSIDEFHRHVQTLRARDLVQSRSDWRAVLPYALANYLAANALTRLRSTQVRRLLVESGHERLLRSFCHRLSYLHDCPAAVAWCEELLRAGGVLGHLLTCTPLQHQLLAYLAPVAPAAALVAIERAAAEDEVAWLDEARHDIDVLRLLAWDAAFFERCVALLTRIVRANRHRVEVEYPLGILVSFCQPNRSGTHIPVARRFALIADWLADPDLPIQLLGRRALEQAMSTTVKGIGNYNFGARSRDSGYFPKTDEELADWFLQGLALLGELAHPRAPHADFARQMLARRLPSLWIYPLLHDALARQMITFAGGNFWREGWLAVLNAQQRGRADLEGRELLQELEAQLAPVDQPSRVLGAVLSGDGVFIAKQPEEDQVAYMERVAVAVRELGRETAADPATLRAVARHLLTRPGRTEDFGIGLAQDDLAHQQVWEILAPELVSVMAQHLACDPPQRTSPHLLRGFMHELAKRNRPLAEHFLQQCAAHPQLAQALPALQAAAGFDRHGLERLLGAYSSGRVPAAELDWLRAAVLAPADVKEGALRLLTVIAGEPGGLQAAIVALQSWLNLAEQPGAATDAALVNACQQVLQHVTFATNEIGNAYSVMRIAKEGIKASAASTLAAGLAERMRVAALDVYSLSSNYEELILLLLEREPEAVLTALCVDHPRALSVAADLLGQETRDGRYPLGQVDPLRLTAWCDEQPGQRYPFALRIVPAVENDAETGRARLTGHAAALLRRSSTPEVTLTELVERMELQSIRNGRGAVLAHNAGALDEVLGWHDASFQAFARGSQQRMLAAGEQQVALETARDRLRNERFE